VPLLEIDGLALTQSHTILRYLAAREGWHARYTAAELALVDLPPWRFRLQELFLGPKKYLRQ
jgi:hypothetical protein